MDNRFFLLLYTGIFTLTSLLSFTCTNTNNFSPDDRPRSVSWIEIKTGLTDSLEGPEANVTDEEFAAHLNKAGFRISWDRVDGADFYEVRASNGKITNKNWKEAALVAKAANTDSAVITTTVDMIQPTITGRNCTGCQSCVPECPRQAITIFKGKAVIDLDSCIGCSRCYEVCTYNAVSKENLTLFYYFAVRAYKGDNVPAEDVTCTDYAYKSRYVNCDSLEIIPGIYKRWCGYCGAGCYILDPSFSPTNKVEFGGCPVDAIYYDDENLIHIDQAKCISCGLCIEECGYNAGHWSVRREIISSE